MNIIKLDKKKRLNYNEEEKKKQEFFNDLLAMVEKLTVKPVKEKE